MGSNNIMNNNKINILLTNDDGIHFEGIKALYTILKDQFNVFVVAPDSEKSASSHSISITKPLLPKETDEYGIKGIRVDGTPADCVKYALQNLHKNKIDLVISGINKGSNNGISVHYSGTVAGVMEGAFYKIPGIAVSLYSYKDNKFLEAAMFIKKFIEENIKNLMERKSILNINIPDKVDYKKDPIFCKQGLGNFNADYVKQTYLNRDYYWAGGPEKEIIEDSLDDDKFVLQNNITITPLKIDLTDYKELDYWKNNQL